MRAPPTAQVAKRFASVARQFCLAVETATDGERTECLVRIYRLLPRLMNEAVQLPDVPLSHATAPSSRPIGVRHKEWQSLYNALNAKLGVWNHYHQVFDPTTEEAAIFGSLADDLADIHEDLRDGLNHLSDPNSSAEEAIWHWRFQFYSHWGQHAIDACRVLHVRLYDTLCP